MPSMTDRKCQNERCGKTFRARTADVKRGWARFCSKSCKAAEQESRTHQHWAHQRRAFYEREYGGIAQFNGRGNYIGFIDIPGSDEHDCNKGDD